MLHRPAQHTRPGCATRGPGRTDRRIGAIAPPAGTPCWVGPIGDSSLFSSFVFCYYFVKYEQIKFLEFIHSTIFFQISNLNEILFFERLDVCAFELYHHDAIL
jgi:hypothetical protein